MKNIFRAVTFMRNMDFESPMKYRGKTEERSIGGFQSDIYRCGNPSKSILVVHGMAPDGYRDYRSIRICESLANIGFLVISPRFPEIEDLVITPDSIDSIKKAAQVCARDKELAPSGKIGLMSASLSAGMSLIAASDGDVAPLVSAICMLGSYCNVEDILTYVFEQDIEDDYGRMLILKNFFHPLAKPGSGLGEAFDIAARDNYYLRKEPHLPACLDRLDDEDRELFRKLRYDRLFMKEARIVLETHYREFLRRLSVVPFLGSIDAPVTLIHGKDDPVIPSAQSQMIHDTLKGLGKESYACLSPLISHSNLTVGIGLIVGLFVLINEFARFFRKV